MGCSFHSLIWGALGDSCHHIAVSKISSKDIGTIDSLNSVDADLERIWQPSLIKS